MSVVTGQEDLKRCAVSSLGQWGCHIVHPIVRAKRRHILEDLLPCGGNGCHGLGN